MRAGHSGGGVARAHDDGQCGPGGRVRRAAMAAGGPGVRSSPREVETVNCLGGASRAGAEWARPRWGDRVGRKEPIERGWVMTAGAGGM